MPIVCLGVDEYLDELFDYRYNLSITEQNNISDKLFLSFVKSIEYIKQHKHYKREYLYDLLTEIYSIMDDELMTLSQFKLLRSLSYE